MKVINLPTRIPDMINSKILKNNNKKEIEYSNLSHQLFHQYKSGVDRLEGLHTSRYFSADIEQTAATKNPATKHQRYFDQMIKFANPKGDWLDARA